MANGAYWLPLALLPVRSYVPHVIKLGSTKSQGTTKVEAHESGRQMKLRLPLYADLDFKHPRVIENLDNRLNGLSKQQGLRLVWIPSSTLTHFMRISSYPQNMVKISRLWWIFWVTQPNDEYLEEWLHDLIDVALRERLSSELVKRWENFDLPNYFRLVIWTGRNLCGQPWYNENWSLGIYHWKSGLRSLQLCLDFYFVKLLAYCLLWRLLTVSSPIAQKVSRVLVAFLMCS